MGERRNTIGVPSKINGKRNPEYARLQRLRWRAANPERHRETRRRQSKRYFERNPEKGKEYARRWRQNHPEYRSDSRESQARRYAWRKKLISRYKRLRGCLDCGIRDPRVLDFDHRGEKNFTIGSCGGLRPMPILKDEIRLCDIRCANCHRIITILRRAVA